MIHIEYIEICMLICKILNQFNMSHLIKYLPPLNELKQQLSENPNIIKYYHKYELFIGDADSLDFIIKELIKYNYVSKNNTI
jgi:hypothetical protein